MNQNTSCTNKILKFKEKINFIPFGIDTNFGIKKIMIMKKKIMFCLLAMIPIEILIFLNF